MLYTDVMVDIETTGTMPDRHGILQISAVKFNLEEMTVDPEFFNVCMFNAPHRSWDQGTVAWWNRKPDVLKSIMQRAQPYQKAIGDFADWSYPAGHLRFWSKPSHFDFMFLSSYFNDAGLGNPFHYREAYDMHSYLRGLWFPEVPPNLEVRVAGPAHDALNDTLWQLKTLFAHIQARKEKLSGS